MIAASSPPAPLPDYAAMRAAMVSSQLRTVAVSDPRVVAAMAQVPREAFVAPAQATLAYSDTALSLGQGRRLNRPLATARLINEVAVRTGERVLLIGAATGYSAAVLARLGAHVTAVECDAELVAAARRALADVPAIALVEGPLEQGHPAGLPYDVLIVDGAVEHLPDTLVSQLVDSGRIATGLITYGVPRLARGTRATGGVGLAPFADIDCVTLPGFARSRGFSF